MKIAFIGQKGIPAVSGGVERYVEDLSVRVVKHGHEAIVYTRPHYTSKDIKEYQGVKLVSLPSINTKHLDAITHTIISTIHAVFTNVDVIHYQSIGPALVSWVPRILNPRIKVVSTLQSKDYEHKKWGWFARTMLRLGEYSMCKFSHEVIAITEVMAKHAHDRYGVEAHLIPNGANLVKNLEVNKIRKWGLEKDNYIVSISRLIRHKGIHYLISAYKQTNSDKKLVIVGDGSHSDEYVTELKTAAVNNSNIIFTGKQSEDTLVELYSNAYLFVQPSESEGLSLALLEAMARGKATLVSDIPENLEAIGKAGFSFKNKNQDDLAKQLNYILTNNEVVKEKGKQAKERIVEHFNWDDIAKEIVKVYTEKKSSRIFYKRLKKCLNFRLF